jgi:hypothetical protein
VALTGVELQTSKYPDVLAAEIVEDPQAALDELALIAGDLRVK